jgi:hypothetical protein
MSVSGKKREWHGAGAINAGTPVDLHVAHSSTSVVYVTKFTVSITTHANGKFAQLQDSSATPVVFAKRTDLTAAAGVPDALNWDFGTWGIPMTAGKNAQGVSEASGPAGWFYAEGWEDIGDGTE